MTSDDPPLTAFDEFLDRLIRGEAVDPDAFLASHPDLPESDRDLLRRLCPGPDVGRRSPEAGETTGALRAPDSPPVERVGSFRLGKRIGVGGMGAVFLADDESLGRRVAVKLLGPDLVGTGERDERFQREIRAAARLRHPNIVTVHAAGEEHGVRWLAMEFVPGSSLQEVLADSTARGTRPPVGDVLRWGIGIARALHEAHEAGIIHRDVKPSNIRIAPDGHPVLLDFGLARDAGAATLTESGAFHGSPQYASPEQVGLGGAPIDLRTDVYSLGATLYEALTGVSPMRGETREQLFHHVLMREPLPLRRLDPSIPKDLETVILATLEKDPRRRHQTAAALADDLEAVRDRKPVSVRPVSRLGRVARWSRRHPARAGLAVALVLGIPAIAALGGFVMANLPKIQRAESADRAAALSHLLEQGFLALSEGGSEEALPMFEEAARDAPSSPEAAAGLVMSRLDQRDAAAAIAMIDGLPESSKSAVWARKLRAEALKWQKKTTEAKKIDAEIPAPETALDHFVFGLVQLQYAHLGEVEVLVPALDHFQRAILLSPSANATYYYELGHAAMHAKRHELARSVAEAIERLWPESPERWFAIGRTLRDTDHAAAARALEKASNPLPVALPSRGFIVLALSEFGDEGQSRRALDLARETVAANPSRPFSHYALAVAEAANHDPQAAVRSFRRALQEGPQSRRPQPFDANCYRKIAQVLQDAGDMDGAIDAWRQLVRLAPKNARNLNSLGIRLLPRGDVDEAIRCFEREVEIDANDAEALCNLGRALEMRGEFEKGLDCVRKGHEIGSKRQGWRYPSAAWVEEAEQKVALAKRLEEVRGGKEDPPSPEERAILAAAVCAPKKLWAEAARLYGEAFEAEPALLSERSPDHVSAAAAAAVLAGTGAGADAPADEGARRALRERARAWLEVAVAKCEPAAAGDSRPGGAARVRAWTQDRAFVRFRPGGDFGGMPAGEAEAWRALWTRCDALAGRQPESAASRVTK